MIMVKKWMCLSFAAMAIFSLTACPSGKKDAGTDTVDKQEMQHSDSTDASSTGESTDSSDESSDSSGH